MISKREALAAAIACLLVAVTFGAIAYSNDAFAYDDYDEDDYELEDEDEDEEAEGGAYVAEVGESDGGTVEVENNAPADLTDEVTNSVSVVNAQPEVTYYYSEPEDVVQLVREIREIAPEAQVSISITCER